MLLAVLPAMLLPNTPVAKLSMLLIMCLDACLPTCRGGLLPRRQARPRRRGRHHHSAARSAGERGQLLWDWQFAASDAYQIQPCRLSVRACVATPPARVPMSPPTPQRSGCALPASHPRFTPHPPHPPCVQEELGIDPSAVTVVACLPPFLSKHLLSVTPVIGIIPPHLRFTPNPTEARAVDVLALLCWPVRAHHVLGSLCCGGVSSGAQDTLHFVWGSSR